MSKRRAAKPADAIALFPFLAVLLCTMGGLLVLLVVLSEAAQRAPIADEPTAVAAADADELRRVAALAEEAAQLERALANGAEKIRQANDMLADQQARLANSEEQQRKLEFELQKLLVALKQLEQTENNQAVDRNQAEAELERLQQLIADTEDQLETLREQEGGPKTYAIIPFRGKNGTYRRPIYVECTADGVVIQPEGIKLAEEDFLMANRAGNPLAAAIRAARERLNSDARAAGKTDLPNAYPLLIVRPEGKQYFFGAKEAIQAWDADFGYEFVDSDWNLEFGTFDPVLADVMNHAVFQSRERMAALAAAAPRRFGMRLVGSGGSGGAGRGGASSGGGWGEGAGGGDGSLAGGTASPPLHTGMFNREVLEADRLASGAGAAGATGGSVVGTGADANGAGDDATGGDGQVDMTGRYGEFVGNGGPGAGGGGAADTGFGSPSGQQSTDGAANGDSGAQGGAAGGTQTAGSGAAGGAGGASAQAAGSCSTGASSSSNSSALAASGSTSASGSSANGSAAGSPAADAANASQIVPQITLQNSAPAGATQPVQSLAATRGVDWALNIASHNSAAITRPVQAVMRKDSIDVLPPRRVDPGVDAAVQQVRLDQSTEDAVNDLVTAVRRHIESWGLAGKGLHWRPVLVLSVAPGAEPNAQKLAQLLAGSGIDVRLPQTAQSPTTEEPHATR
ncbi:MAG: hypothetical protein CMJ58_03910 [Planctomycetaceae bacterium]|nr:hypothetical protein [Planctomycetaceae bacterium]